MAKVDEPVIECWAQILNRVPGSTLLLKYRWLSDSFVASDLRRRFEKYGVDPRRLVFGYSSAHYEYLLSYKDIDIALDPFPYNGGLTSSEALHMNTPIITLEGDDYVSRVGVSLLTKLGMGEKWIAKTR
jgi:predicted O-linked N-acetylglucosamine transferase (SPINDLY family)